MDAGQLFACPYAKFDADRYSSANLDELKYRGCSHCYLTDISRVKQHLYRVHARPQYFCPTCFVAFKSHDKLTKHTKSRSCTARPCLFEEKMTVEQVKLIKKKHRRTDLAQYWNDIYQILFPDSPLPASPFAAFTNVRSGILDGFVVFLQQELPLRLSEQVGDDVVLHAAMRQRFQESLVISVTQIMHDLRREFELQSQQDVPSTADQTVMTSPDGFAQSAMVYQVASNVASAMGSVVQGTNILLQAAASLDSSSTGKIPATGSQPHYTPREPFMDVDKDELMQEVAHETMSAGAWQNHDWDASLIEACDNMDYFVDYHPDVSPRC